MIDPRGLTVTEWADATILAVDSAWSSVGRLDDEASWQAWGTGFLNTPSFATQAVPDPYQFSDWRDWAMRVNALLEG